MLRQKKCQLPIHAAYIAIALLLTLPSLPLRADDGSHEQKRVTDSGNVMKELINSPSGIPSKVLNTAGCVIILPNTKKAAFIVGGSYGRGVMTCRGGKNFEGPWTAPTMMESSGANFGRKPYQLFQPGGTCGLQNSRPADRRPTL